MDGVEARCGNDSTAGVQQAQIEKDSSVDIVTQTDEGLLIILMSFSRLFIIIIIISLKIIRMSM